MTERGGGYAMIGYGGSFGGLSYERLCELGTGTHFNSGFDERKKTDRGATRESESEAVQKRRSYQLCLYMDRLNSSDTRVSFTRLLFLMTPASIGELDPYIIPEHREWLKDFANQIPAGVAGRDELRKRCTLGIFGSGGFHSYPDEDSKTVKRMLGD